MKACTVLMFVMSICAFSDSAVMYEFPDGRTVAMISSGEISMAAESVFIAPAEGNWENGWIPNMQVRCVFELVNNTFEEQTLSVGFPFDAKYGNAYTAMDEEMLFEMLSESYADEYRPSWREEQVIQGLDAEEDIPEDLDFRTSINGAETEVYFRKCALSLQEDILWRPVVAVWKMHFDPHETVILENTYNTVWDYFGGGPGGSYTMNYILTSGGTWNGPIGDVFVELTVPEQLPEPCLNDTLGTYWEWTGSPVIQGRTVTWQYSDLEPEENLSFTVECLDRLGFWENFIDPVEMYDRVTWTREDLQRTAVEYMDQGNFWDIGMDGTLALRIAEALPWLSQGAEPPNGILLEHFTVSGTLNEPVITPEMEDRRDLAQQLLREQSDRIMLAESDGYLDFLPMFVMKKRWEPEDLDMYAAMPRMNDCFLHLLEYLESAVNGAEIPDPGVRAFYELTGWYSPGCPDSRTPLPVETVLEYGWSAGH